MPSTALLGRHSTAGAYHERAEAAPVVALVPLLLSALAAVGWMEEWMSFGLPSWGWLAVASPALLLALDLWLGPRGLGFARTRSASLALLALLVAGNLVGLVALVTALVSAHGIHLSGAQLLFSAGAIWATNVVVFGMCFWELDGGGPVERQRRSRPADLQFPQRASGAEAWRPTIWDYLYTSLSTATAFSPTDAMPLTLRAKTLMGTEAVLCLVIVVLVTARAVNVLGT